MSVPRASALPALVVGTGFGCRIQVPALRAAGFSVVGLVGNNPERTARRAQKSGVPQAFTDLDHAIAKTSPVLVTVATPPHTHGPLVLAALSRGCHVLCEKPFARDAAEARAMFAAAQDAGVVHVVGHEFRWMPDRAIIARAIADGLIGEPRFATLTLYTALVASPDFRMPNWWFDPSAGGGWLGASGSHVIDQVRTWLGEFASLSAALPVVSAREGVAEDSYAVRFRMVDGTEGTMQQTGGAWGPTAAMSRVAGTKGTLWSTEGNDVWLADREGARQQAVPPDLALPPPPGPSDDLLHQLSHLELGPYTRLCEALRAAIEGRAHAAPVPLPTFADGVACMEVLDAIRASAANGGAVVALATRRST